MSVFTSFRTSLWLKLALAVAAAGLGDLLFWGSWPGSTLGGFALALTVATVLVRPAMTHDRRALAASVTAAALACVVTDDPNLLAWCLFWTALSVAGLSCRIAPGADALAWAGRLALAPLVGIAAPVLDWLKLRRHRRRSAGRSWLAYWPQLVLPAVGGAVFLGLFFIANPVLHTSLHLERPGQLDVPRLSFWLFLLVSAWMVLRPSFLHWRRKSLALPRPIERAGVTVLSVGLSLVVFNTLFAVQNALDIAFLWSGARLPGKITMADYAHRGAFTLILTAMLAGVFVLFALQPHSTTARSRPLRALVVLWLAQNLLLVASSILRTVDYTQSYGLTALRLSALAWMALVGIGLALICWRLLRGRSASWLINANALAAGLVLLVCSVIDLDAASAAWNVRHCAEVGGRAVRLDLADMGRIGDAALVPLSDLDHRRLPPAFRAKVEALRADQLADLRRRQSDWRTWTWRGQRRLDRAEALRPSGGMVIIAATDARLTRPVTH